MGQFDAAQVRNMIITYGADETARRLAAEGMSQEQIESLINNSVFEGKAPADEIVKFQKKIGGKNVELRIPLGKDMEIPMNAMADTFVKEGFNKLETKDDKLYGVYYATGEKEELADVKQEKAKFLKQQEEEMLAEQKKQAEIEQQGRDGLLSSAWKGLWMFGAPAAAVAAPVATAIVGVGVAAAACGDKDDTTRIEVGLNQNTFVQFSLGEALKSVLDAALKPVTDRLDTLIEKSDEHHKEIINKFNSYLDKLQDIYNAQYATKEAMEKAVSKAVLDIIGWLATLNENLDANTTRITDILMEILNSGKPIEDILKEILAKMDEVKNTVIEAKLAIIEKLGEDNKAVLEELEKHGDILNQIRDLMLQYGEKGEAFAKAVLEALGNAGGKDYTELLTEIKELIATLDANNETRTQRIIDAIGKLGADISGDITKIINKIPDNKDYSEVLDKILAAIGTLKEDVNGNFESLLEAIGNIDIKPADLSWIKDHLDAILKAIKDHDVIVKVEGGKCCCCNNDGTPVNEGIIKNLNDLLG